MMVAITAGTHSGLTACPSDNDYYNFTLAAGDELTVDLTFVDADGDIDPAHLVDYLERARVGGHDVVGIADRSRGRHRVAVGEVHRDGEDGEGGGFVMAAAAWLSSDNSSLSAGVLLPYGSTLDEYWYYPSSVYLKGEFYF